MRAHRRDNFLFSSFMSYNTICFARLRCPFTSLTARLAAAKRHNRSPILIIPASYSLNGLCSLSLNWIKPRRRASWLDLFIFPDVLYYSPGYYGRVWAASKSEISSHLYLSLFFLSLSLGSQFFPAHPFDDYLVYSSDFLFLLTLIEIRAMSALLPHAPFPSPSRSGVGNHNCKRTAYKSHLVFWKTEFRYFFFSFFFFWFSSLAAAYRPHSLPSCFMRLYLVPFERGPWRIRMGKNDRSGQVRKRDTAE